MRKNSGATASSPPSPADPNFRFYVLPEEPEGLTVRPAGGVHQASAPPASAGEDALKIVLAAIRDVRFSVAEARPKHVSAEAAKDIERRVAWRLHIGALLASRSFAFSVDHASSRGSSLFNLSMAA